MLRSIRLEESRQRGLLDKLQAEIKIDIGYLGLAIISSFIATFALLIEDLPILIGAMLIAPFLTPPLGVGMGLVKGDIRLFKQALVTLSVGIAIGVIGAILISIVSPIKEINDEIISRSAPTLIQLIIAILAGGAGAFAYAHRKIRAVLAGAFIAMALVPPISIIGIGIAFWNWEVVGGGALLLTANLVGLTLAAVILFFLLGFRPIDRPENLHEVKIGITWLAIILFIIVLPLGYIMKNILVSINQEKLTEEIILEQIDRYPETEIDKLTLTKVGPKIKVSFNIHSSQMIDTALVQEIKNRLEREFKHEVEIDARLVPTFKIDY